MGWQPALRGPHGPLCPGPGARDRLTHPAFGSGAAFPALELEADRTAGRVDFPRALRLGTRQAPRILSCQCVCYGGETPGSQLWYQGRLRPSGRDHRCLPQSHQDLRIRIRQEAAPPNTLPLLPPWNPTSRPGTEGHGDLHSTCKGQEGAPQQPGQASPGRRRRRAGIWGSQRPIHLPGGANMEPSLCLPVNSSSIPLHVREPSKSFFLQASPS